MNHRGAIGREPGYQQRIHKSGLRAEGSRDDLLKIIDLPGDRFNRVPMRQDAIPVHLHAGTTAFVLRLEHVAVMAQLDNCIDCQIARHGLREGCAIAHIHQVFMLIQSYNADHMHVRLAYIRPAQNDLVPQG